MGPMCMSGTIGAMQFCMATALRRAGMGVCAVPALGNPDRVPLIFAGYVLD